MLNFVFFLFIFVGFGDFKEKRYFFSLRKDCDCTDNKRPAGCGYWKSVGNEKQIIASESNQVVGMKKTLVFYEPKRARLARTRWVMHELRLLPSQTPQVQIFNIHQ